VYTIGFDVRLCVFTTGADWHMYHNLSECHPLQDHKASSARIMLTIQWYWLQGINPGEIGLEEAVKLLAKKAAKGPGKSFGRKGKQPAAKKGTTGAKASSGKAPAKEAFSSKTTAKTNGNKAAETEGAAEKPARKARKEVAASEDASYEAADRDFSGIKASRSMKKAVKGDVKDGEGGAAADVPAKARRGRPRKVALAETVA
jgi:hypothetical protein